MPEIAGQVAEGFADAVREHEEPWLSPLAVRSYQTRGRGLTLRWGVRDDILRHPGREGREPLEGRIVRLVARSAYITHDIDAAVGAGPLDPAELPAEPIALLGDTGSRRIDTLVHDVV